MPTDGWLTGEEVAKLVACDKAPKPVVTAVHVDTAVQPTKSEQTCGQMYDTATKPEASAPCPNCGADVTHVDDATTLYQIDMWTAAGKPVKRPVPKCPVPGFDREYLYYKAAPCGCRVSEYWATDFTVAKHNKKTGVPFLVSQMTAEKKAELLKKLEDGLSKLYAKKEEANTPTDETEIDYWIVILVDQIQRLCPGPHNQTALPLKALKWWPQPASIDLKVKLAPKVAEWAEKNSFAKQAAWMSQDAGEPWIDTGYGNAYKPPPGFKGAPLKIETDSLACAFEVSGTPLRISAKWSDGTIATFDSVSQVKQVETALLSAMSAVERGRGKALQRAIPQLEGKIDEAKAKAASAKKPAFTKKEILKGLWPDSASGFFSQLMNDFKANGSAVTYFAEPFSEDVLRMACDYFSQYTEFMTSLVHQNVLGGEDNGYLRLLETCAAIRNEIRTRFENYGKSTKAMSPEAGELMTAFSAKVDLSGDAKPSASGPVMLPPKPESTRHHRKRRTIRPVEE